MEPRPAATVIVARKGVEVLVERRTASSRFAPGFVVFPGGAVGEEDLASEDPARACAVRELREETGLVLSAESLVEIARWVAPEFLEVRFDARFFVAAAPADAVPVPDGVEIAEAWWARPADVLDASIAGDAPLMWPTLAMLHALEACSSVEDVLALRVPQIHPPAMGEVPAGYRGAWGRPEGGGAP